jgi:hypothetical protein
VASGSAASPAPPSASDQATQKKKRLFRLFARVYFKVIDFFFVDIS